MSQVLTVPANLALMSELARRRGIPWVNKPMETGAARPAAEEKASSGVNEYGSVQIPALHGAFGPRAHVSGFAQPGVC